MSLNYVALIGYEILQHSILRKLSFVTVTIVPAMNPYIRWRMSVLTILNPFLKILFSFLLNIRRVSTRNYGLEKRIHIIVCVPLPIECVLFQLQENSRKSRSALYQWVLHKQMLQKCSKCGKIAHSADKAIYTFSLLKFWIQFANLQKISNIEDYWMDQLSSISFFCGALLIYSLIKI